MFSEERAVEEDAEADSWAEVMAAAEMALKAVIRAASLRAGAVKSANPLFQLAYAEEEAAKGVVVAGVAAGILSEETCSNSQRGKSNLSGSGGGSSNRSRAAV